MPVYSSAISELLYEEDVKLMYDKAKSPQEAYLIAMLWTTGARPSEILELTKEAFVLREGKLLITIATKKLGNAKGFTLQTRELDFERPEGLEANIYIEFIIRFVSANPSGVPILKYTLRWTEWVINSRSIETLGKKLTPYHFRHSVLTWLAHKGAMPTELQHFKGSKSIASVMPYVHAKPFVIKAQYLRRSRGV